MKALYHPSQPVTGTILVADDQASNRELLEELLTAQGFKVTPVSNGVAALKELAETQVDLVLLDVTMPHLSGSFRLVLPIIRHHHEKLDGSGYPDGLRGDAIPTTARILQIVDVYDALTTERPYKRAFSPADAFLTMKEEVAKGWWNPRIFQQFEQLMKSGTAESLHRGAGAGQ